MWANGKENGRLIVTKLDILCELHAVIAARLFGEGPWLMEREDALLTRQKVLEMGLEKQVTEDMWQHTPFAEEIDFDLLSVFMGWQAPPPPPVVTKG